MRISLDVTYLLVSSVRRKSAESSFSSSTQLYNVHVFFCIKMDQKCTLYSVFKFVSAIQNKIYQQQQVQITHHYKHTATTSYILEIKHDIKSLRAGGFFHQSETVKNNSCVKMHDISQKLIFESWAQQYTLTSASQRWESFCSPGVRVMAYNTENTQGVKLFCYTNNA